MTRYHMTHEGPVLFTAEEEIARDAEEAAWTSGAKNLYNAEIKEKRSIAYVREADPLFFKAQRGEATMQEWQDKVDEIKVRLQYQE
jgi:hypothetical protein